MTAQAAPTAPACLLTGDASAGDALLHDRYAFPPHPEVTLPHDLTWAEDPLRDRNWRFDFHALRWVENLWAAWTSTNDQAYEDRYVELLQDWYDDNPVNDPPSDFSWNDHAAAWRGVVYACALKRLIPRPDWLTAAAQLHGSMLADDNFYVHHGNHALNQSIGLLELGCALPNLSWRDLAASRMETLIRESVDSQGATNEQSDGYELYNYGNYSLAAQRMQACGVTPSAEFMRRLNAMPHFMAMAASPGGKTVMIGDTSDVPIPQVGEAQYAATNGAQGTRPTALWMTCTAGYEFIHSGWGSPARQLDDESVVTARFGPGRAYHGHNDAASVTLGSWGNRILIDPGGPHDFNSSSWETYFRSENAHNTVTVDGLKMYNTGSTSLIGERHVATFDFVALRHTKYHGVVHQRRVFYSRDLDLLVVEDHLTSSVARTYRQLWHLLPDASPQWYGSNGGFITRRADGANVKVRQLVGDVGRRVITGQTSPLQGWVTWSYGSQVAAPVVSLSDRGTDVRFVTLFLPGATTARGLSVKHFSLRSEGFDLTLATGGVTERVLVSATTASEARIS